MADPASGSGDKSVQVKLVLLGETTHPEVLKDVLLAQSFCT